MNTVNGDKNHNPLIVGCNYRFLGQRYPLMHFVLVDINFNSGMARLITRKTKKDFWININRLMYIMNESNERKADRIAKEGIEYLKALIGHKHAQNWADRMETQP